MKRTHTEDERRAVFNYFMSPILPSPAAYDLVNPKVVDDMLCTFTGARIVLAMRVAKLGQVITKELGRVLK